MLLQLTSLRYSSLEVWGTLAKLVTLVLVMYASGDVACFIDGITYSFP